MQRVHFEDLGQMDYKTAWDYQEQLLRENVEVKSLLRSQASIAGNSESDSQLTIDSSRLTTHDSRLTTHDWLFTQPGPIPSSVLILW